MDVCTCRLCWCRPNSSTLFQPGLQPRAAENRRRRYRFTGSRRFAPDPGPQMRGGTTNKGRHPRGQRPVFDPKLLLMDVVLPIASLILHGLDLQIMFLGRAGQEAAHAVRLPPRSLPDLGKGSSLWPPNQCQNLGAFALSARCGGLASRGRLALLPLTSLSARPWFCRPLPFSGSAALPPFYWLPSALRPGAAPLARPVPPSWRPNRGFKCGSCCSSILFCARLAHDDLYLWCAPNASKTDSFPHNLLIQANTWR